MKDKIKQEFLNVFGDHAPIYVEEINSLEIFPAGIWLVNVWGIKYNVFVYRDKSIKMWDGCSGWVMINKDNICIVNESKYH